jgi:hypothetical protein
LSKTEDNLQEKFLVSESTLSDDQLEEIKTLLCSEDEADQQQAGERLQAA